jgi:FAD/FMN-containing dehydrogenase
VSGYRNAAQAFAGPTDVRAAYDELAYRRLAALRARLDPDGLLRTGHPIPSVA